MVAGFKGFVAQHLEVFDAWSTHLSEFVLAPSWDGLVLDIASCHGLNEPYLLYRVSALHSMMQTTLPCAFA